MADSAAPQRPGQRQRARHTTLWALAAAAAAAPLWGALKRPPDELLTDLHIYIDSAEKIREGGSLYDFTGRDGAPFTYPPFAGVAFLLLTLADEGVIQALWTVATAAVVVYLGILVSRWSPARARIQWWALAPLATMVLFLSAPVSSNLRFGQISIFLSVLVLVDACGTRSPRWSGVATGVSAATKLTPMIFIPMFWLSGRWRAALAAAFSFIACGLVGLVILPGDSARFWLHSVTNVNRIGHIQTSGNQSLNGALIRLAVDAPVRGVLVLTVSVLVGVIALVRASRAARADNWFSAVTVVGAASVVVSPVSWTHHQIWLVLAAFLAPFGDRTGDVVWLVGVAIIMIAPLPAIAAALPWGSGLVFENCRLLLALVVACLIPVHHAVASGSDRRTPDHARAG